MLAPFKTSHAREAVGLAAVSSQVNVYEEPSSTVADVSTVLSSSVPALRVSVGVPGLTVKQREGYQQ